MYNDFLDYLGQAPAPARKPATRTQPKAKAPSFVRSADIVPQSIVVPEMKPANTLILVENYSERSFAIFGDTKPMKDKLDQLGGKFNRWLKKEGQSTPGYIFSVTRLDTVKKALNL